MAYEPARDLWFLMRSNLVLGPGQPDQLVVRRFDRGTDQWETINDAGPEIPVNQWDSFFFALNDRLVLRDETGQLRVLDTSDPEEILEVGEYDPPPGFLWDAVGARTKTGGDVNFVSWGCVDADPCAPEDSSLLLTRLQVSATGAALQAPTVLYSFFYGANSQSQGSIVHDINFDRLILVTPEDVPGAPTLEGTATVAIYGRGTHAKVDPPGDLIFPQHAGKIRQAAFDPCQATVYAGSIQITEIRGIATDASTQDPPPVTKDIGRKASALVYEPYTRSLIVADESLDGFAVDAWTAQGTKDIPDIRKRSTVEWAPPNDLRPSFLAVEDSPTPLCD